MTSWQNAQHIAIWGYGMEGQAAYAFIRQHATCAKISLLLDTPPEDPQAMPVTWYVGKEAMEHLIHGTFDLVIKSPGISLYRSEAMEAQKRGVVLTSGTNLWFEQHPQACTVVVTGTKGKSTTASLLHHGLSYLGCRSVLAGNIGVPLLSLNAKEEVDVYVLELSSYQLADLHYAPSMLLITNLYPEHTAWHGSVERYYRDKWRVAELQPHPHVIAHAGSTHLRQLAQDYHQPITWFNQPQGIHVCQGLLYDRDKPLAMNMPLRGEHNLHNFAAVLTTIKALSYDLDSLSPDAWVDFEPLPHRLQELGERQGVLCVDDSIATIPESTQAALAVYQDYPGITLILGGHDRQQDYSLLCQQLEHFHVVHVFLMPDNGSRIAQTMQQVGCGVPFTLCTDLRQAIDLAFRYTPQGGVLLLSPAAPSYGHFENFKERGRQFAHDCGFL